MNGTIVVLMLSTLFILMTVSQDLQFECISCADKFDKCELDCAWDLQGTDVAAIMACQSGCFSTKRQCVDTPAAESCASCALVCGEAYDTAMRRCLALVSKTTRATYDNRELADCEEGASAPMDACMKLCSKS